MSSEHPLSPAARAIAARFPGPVTLRPGRGKWILILVFLVAFYIAAAAMMLQFGEAAAAVIVGCVVFAPGILVAGLCLIPSSGCLMLDEHGFEMTRFFRRQWFQWRDVSGFQAATITLRMMPLGVVGFDWSRANPRIRDMNRKMMQRDMALADTYGLTAPELADLMENWRARALALDAPANEKTPAETAGVVSSNQ